MKTAAILLAAGLSSRMAEPKPLLDWFGQPLVSAQAKALIQAGVEHVTVVIGAYADNVKSSLPPFVSHVINKHFAQGKVTSVISGVKSLPLETDTIAILAVDQPRPASLIRYAIRQHAQNKNKITVPRNNEGGGHPIIFDGSLREELASVTDQTEGIRAIINRHKTDLVILRMDTPLIRIDLNTPEDYASAITKYQQLVKEWENVQK